MLKTQIDVGFTVGMKEEAELLASFLGLKYENDNVSSYCKYTNKDKSLVILTPGIDINYIINGKPFNRVGKVSAGIITTILVKEYEPKIVINCGTAGGIGKKISIGDLVVADYVTNHDINFPYRSSNLWAQRKVPLKFNHKLKFLKSKYKLGTVTSSESFSTTPEDWKIIDKSKAIAKDMEAAGFIQALEIVNYTNPHFIFKSITDIASISMEEKRTYKLFLKNFTFALTNLSKIIEELVSKRENLF